MERAKKGNETGEGSEVQVSWTWSWVICSGWLCFGREDGLDDLQSSFLPPTILCFPVTLWKLEAIDIFAARQMNVVHVTCQLQAHQRKITKPSLYFFLFPSVNKEKGRKTHPGGAWESYQESTALREVRWQQEAALAALRCVYFGPIWPSFPCLDHISSVVVSLASSQIKGLLCAY